MTHSERVAKLKVQTCDCGAKLRPGELQCKDCREQELIEEAMD